MLQWPYNVGAVCDSGMESRSLCIALLTPEGSTLVLLGMSARREAGFCLPWILDMLLNIYLLCIHIVMCTKSYNCKVTVYKVTTPSNLYTYV